jgi:superoxide dismutase
VTRDSREWSGRTRGSPNSETARDAGEIEGNQVYPPLRAVKVDYTFALLGLKNHELYFGHLGGDGGEPTGRFAEFVDDEFHVGLEAWQQPVRKDASAARGWVMVGYGLNDASIFNYLMDSQNLWAVYNMVPFLAIDVYEHAYVGDFGATPDGRKQYVVAFFRNLDWDHVNRQLIRAEAAREDATRTGLTEAHAGASHREGLSLMRDDERAAEDWRRGARQASRRPCRGPARAASGGGGTAPPSRGHTAGRRQPPARGARRPRRHPLSGGEGPRMLTLSPTAAQAGTIRAVVSRGGRPDLTPEPLLSEVVAPTLLIAGDDDTPVIEMNHDARRRQKTEVELEIVAGASHLFEEPGALERVADLASAWFVRHLAGDGS